MAFLRSSLFSVGMAIILLLVVFTILVFFYMPLKFRYAIASKWALYSIWWLKVTVGLDYRIQGVESIPKTASIILSNHQSTWEVMALQLVFPQQVWVLKKSLLFIPFFGLGVALVDPIVINRKNKIQALKAVIKQGINRLSRGLWVVIFPEGTRQNSVGKYQNSGALVAIKAAVPIVPVYHNAGKFWQKGQFIKTPGTITMVIGKPISTAGKSAKELSLKVENWAKAQEKHLQASD